MRRGLPSIALLASLGLALSGCADTGAHLTFTAPNGPQTAASFRVVLATPEHIPTIQNQRVKVGDNTTTQSVSYFLQRTVAGATAEAIDEVDGFTVRIAPDSAVADTQFIPFVLIYDRADKLIGIGTYRAGDPLTPSPILVVTDEIDKYKLDVEAVVQVSDMDAPAPGQVHVVECFAQDQSSFTSGIVWRPLGGGELRIVLPDDGGTDATGRALDLDCDDHAVTAESSRPDCDDTRGWFHRDASDVCDGYDTNCDGLQSIATTCEAPISACIDVTSNMPVPGAELCDDTTGEVLGCNARASCACNAGGNCFTCVMPFADGSTDGIVKPCYPAIGMMSTFGKCSETGPCTIEVLGAHNGWKIEVATTATSSFGIRALNVHDSFAIKARREDGFELMGGASTHLTDIELAFNTPTTTYFWPVRLRLDEGPSQATGCPPMAALTCYP